MSLVVHLPGPLCAIPLEEDAVMKSSVGMSISAKSDSSKSPVKDDATGAGVRMNNNPIVFVFLVIDVSQPVRSDPPPPLPRYPTPYSTTHSI